jgi:hypothetical protein
MANVFLTDMQMLNQGNNESVDTALSAFEKNMFGGSANEKEQVSNDATPDTLRYLFAIFN